MSPFWYTVTVGSYRDTMKNVQRMVMASQCHMMTPSNHENLNRFLKAYQLRGDLKVAPSYWAPGQAQPEVYEELEISCEKLIVREAWEIGPNNADIHGITGEYNPVIPAGITDAPVIQTLAKIKEMMGKHGF